MGGSRCQVDAQSRFAAVASYALRLIRMLADIVTKPDGAADGRRKVAATEVEAESVAAVPSGEGESTFFGVRSPEFLGRMHEQLDELVSARDQMGQLLQLAMEIGSDLELDAALHRIITAAMRTTGARYGALGVWASDDTLSSFV
ncbi:MAG: hypothetical protein JOZ49_02230, partial [Mycolicibacterium sp.]|nr:hypothetical protein [Mycolicibacterium sp.]